MLSIGREKTNNTQLSKFIKLEGMYSIKIQIDVKVL